MVQDDRCQRCAFGNEIRLIRALPEKDERPTVQSIVCGECVDADRWLTWEARADEVTLAIYEAFASAARR